MARRDFYEVLGLNRNANQEEIKKAYKKLAFEYHPDRNPGNPSAEERFKEINEAYQVLSNPEKRARYDSFGHMTNEGLFSDFEFSGNFNDLFENLFDEVFNAGRRRRPERGRDLKYNLEIDFEEAAFGTEKEISLPKRVVCSECGGRGAAPGGESVCLVCGGKGAMDRLFRIFNELHIPCFILFDYDNGSTDKNNIDKSKELLDLAGEKHVVPSSLFIADGVACFRRDWETDLRSEISERWPHVFGQNVPFRKWSLAVFCLRGGAP